MDDCFVYGPVGPLLVASLDLCLAWLFSCHAVHRVERSAWCYLSRNVSGGGSDELWALWELVARFQSRRYGVVSRIPFSFKSG